MACLGFIQTLNQPREVFPSRSELSGCMVQARSRRSRLHVSSFHEHLVAMPPAQILKSSLSSNSWLPNSCLHSAHLSTSRTALGPLGTKQTTLPQSARAANQPLQIAGCLLPACRRVLLAMPSHARLQVALQAGQSKGLGFYSLAGPA